MNIQEVMDTELLTIAPEITLREAAQQMSGRNVGAALLLDAAIGSFLVHDQATSWGMDRCS